ncbi:MAG: isoprenylcysteine carboxylmethyltransferase family protein [Gammaproteobacteria bacterium]|nr:isoprenylcysteine carboxylmethyltransferase family protein [Gammaproteobacteria bacterium]
MKKLIIFLYGVASYFLFFGVFIYAIFWVGNILVPNSIDAAPMRPLGDALMIDVLLVALFGLQHSIMARKSFKSMITKIIPKASERSTYVLMSSIMLGIMVFFWQPLGGEIWHVESQAGQIALYALFGLGWSILFLASFLINHFELFGLQQVWHELRNKAAKDAQFKTPFLYKMVRHPIYLGWIIGVWATPIMTVTHLAFAVLTTTYIFIGVYFEERDLVKELGMDYVDYKRQVPMIIPGFGRSKTLAPASAES